MTNILIIGAGGIGERHLRCFQKVGAGAVGIVESNAERRELMASRYGCPSFADLEEALAADSWQAGVVASPAPTHVPLSLVLLRAGADVLIEKPLALALEDLDELRDYDGRRTIRIAYVYRHMPSVLELKRRLESGGFGAPLAAQIACGEDFSLARPDYARTYYARHETGGGIIQDLLTHFTNAMDWLVGPAEAVQCLAANRKLKDISVEDTVCCSIRHRDGCLASYFIAQGQTARETVFTVHCEHGSLRADVTNLRVGECRNGEWIWTEPDVLERDDFYVRQARGFLQAREGRGDSSCSLDEAVHSVRTVVATMESARSGRLLEIRS